MIKLKRISAGVYANDRITIKREVSKQTYRADEYTWSLTLDGQQCNRDFDTKKEALSFANKKLSNS